MNKKTELINNPKDSSLKKTHKMDKILLILISKQRQKYSEDQELRYDNFFLNTRLKVLKICIQQ